jgi:type II secretory pathway pseudopilin PulG
MRSGTSLLELSVALALFALGLGLLVPAARRQIDRMAVLAAREAVVARIGRAAREARLAGGAALELRRDGSRLWIDAAGQPPDTLELEERYGARLELAGPSATIAFDALGIGRLANRTLAVVRGAERAELTVSAYGRIRRR